MTQLSMTQTQHPVTANAAPHDPDPAFEKQTQLSMAQTQLSTMRCKVQTQSLVYGAG